MTVTVRMFGTTFPAAPIKKLASGDWQMTALAHTGRTRPGTTIIVKEAEVLDPQNLTSAIAPAATIDPTLGLDAMEKAMAEELKTLPATPAQLIAQHQAANAEGKTPTPDPMRPRKGPHPLHSHP
jgi:hypothetical protein